MYRESVNNQSANCNTFAGICNANFDWRSNPQCETAGASVTMLLGVTRVFVLHSL